MNPKKVYDNPSPEELRAFTEEMPTSRITEFGNVNIMGVAHGREKDALLAHKAAIDAHFVDVGIPVSYTNVFWGGRSEIKPSEISPLAYRDWCARVGLSL